jgi:transposase
VARAEELQAQVDVLKAKVAQLQQRLFGRKSERRNRAPLLGGTEQSGVARRARGQQPGRAGHGRKVQGALAVSEVGLDLTDQEKRCPYCGLVWDPFGLPHRSEQIEWEVRLFRRRTIRPKYRRPAGCRCQPERPDIVSAPPAPAWIPKGLLANSFLTEVLVLKFLYHVPLERIRALARSAGLALSAGTLCGALETLTPLFAPLYDAIQAQSRRAPLCLMDETRWEVFVEQPNKGSHRWWLWVVVTHQTRLYIVAPSRSAAVPKAYFGYDPAGARCRYEPMVVVDRFKAYAFLKGLLQLAYCWAHVRRDFLHLRLGGPEQEAWADGWIERIGKLYELNAQRLTLAKSQDGPEAWPAPFLELDPARLNSAEYAQADKAVHQALADMEQQCAQELAQGHLGRLRRKVLTSLQAHWPGLTLFADHPQLPMDNNGAERAIRPGTIGRKNYYGSASTWSAHLLALRLTLVQTLVLHRIDPRTYLRAYLDACALNGSKAPESLEPWLPWNFIDPEAAGGGLRRQGRPSGRAGRAPHEPARSRRFGALLRPGLQPSRIGTHPRPDRPREHLA